MNKRMNRLSMLAPLLAALLSPAQSVFAACNSAASCVAPSLSQAEALLGKIEQQFPQFFAPAAATQTLSLGSDTAYYRSYANASSTALGTYQGGLWYAVNGQWSRYGSLDQANAQFCNSACWSTGTALGPFKGNIVLGAPTANSIKANVYASDQSGTVQLQYGTVSGRYDSQGALQALSAGKPLELSLSGLAANTRYYYRLYFESASGSGPTEEYSFHTARPPGSSFTFALQGDSHPERLKTQFDSSLYQRTLLTASADQPDFYLTMGDDFSVDTLDPATINASKVTERYTLQRPYLGLIGRSAPVFLVNGNHEQAARYLLDGTPNNVAVWAQNARNSHYSQPAPDGFYTGNTESVPFIGQLRNYYAWTWGDALFVVIDPYWSSPVAVDNVFGGPDKRPDSMWDITHGEEQYQWLQRTLEQSTAKYKFVFAHHVMGSGRGGVELASNWEWGGSNTKGVYEFPAQRPNWVRPIHQLMVANKVTIFFQGHDHIWVRQQLDGVTYQTLSEPADPNYSWFNADAYVSGDKFPNTGYTRVTVAPSGVKVDYVRTYLAKDEGSGRTSGVTAFSYTLP